jgi:two-component system sensor histidine kinase DegS
MYFVLKGFLCVGNKILQPEILDEIVRKTITSLESGKKQIFEIADEARNEWQELESKLNTLKNSVKETIEEVEKLYALEKESRQRLMVVSKNFKIYTEEDIKKAYDAARDFQIKLALSKDREQHLKTQRNELETRIRKMRNTLERADYLVSQVAVAMNYLINSLMNISNTLEEMQKKELLGIQVLVAQEEERQRLARDIHDGPAQSLSNIVLKCEICEKFFETDLMKAKQEIKDLKKLVRSSLKELRDIIFDLRPMSLDDLGLLPTLQGYISKFSEETAIKVELDLFVQSVEIDPIIEVAVFRIIQETLSNIKKHSKAERATIKLQVNDGILKATVSDNGVGFDYDRRQKHSKDNTNADGFGIYGMRQRAELLKGKLSLESQRGKGTTIRLDVPIRLKEKGGVGE